MKLRHEREGGAERLRNCVTGEGRGHSDLLAGAGLKRNCGATDEKGNVFQDVPVTVVLSAALLAWKDVQESFKARRIRFPGGIAFAGSPLVFAGYSGEPFSNRAFNLRLRAACRGGRGGAVAEDSHLGLTLKSAPREIASA
jgi:hypothetical protein